MCVHGELVLKNTLDRCFPEFPVPLCLQSLGSHGDGAAAINMHQVLEKEGVLLFNHNNVSVSRRNILSNIYGVVAFSSFLSCLLWRW